MEKDYSKHTSNSTTHYRVGGTYDKDRKGIGKMKRFEIGEVYEVKYKSNKRWGEVAGELEIVDIRRIDNPEFKRISIRDCFEAHAGEIDYIVRSGSTNEKIKTLHKRFCEVEFKLFFYLFLNLFLRMAILLMCRM